MSRALLAPIGRTSSRRPFAVMRTTRDLRSTSDSSGSSALYLRAAHAFEAHAGV